jgi:hypothetical protein
MAVRQRHELFPIDDVIATGADQDRANALLRNSCEGCFEIAIGSGIHNNELQAQREGRRLQVCDSGLGRKPGVHEDAEHSSVRYQLAQQLQSFRPQLDI